MQRPSAATAGLPSHAVRKQGSTPSSAQQVVPQRFSCARRWIGCWARAARRGRGSASGRPARTGRAGAARRGRRCRTCAAGWRACWRWTSPGAWAWRHGCCATATMRRSAGRQRAGKRSQIAGGRLATATCAALPALHHPQALRLLLDATAQGTATGHRAPGTAIAEAVLLALAYHTAIEYARPACVRLLLRRNRELRMLRLNGATLRDMLEALAVAPGSAAVGEVAEELAQQYTEPSRRGRPRASARSSLPWRRRWAACRCSSCCARGAASGTRWPGWRAPQLATWSCSSGWRPRAAPCR